MRRIDGSPPPPPLREEDESDEGESDEDEDEDELDLDSIEGEEEDDDEDDIDTASAFRPPSLSAGKSIERQQQCRAPQRVAPYRLVQRMVSSTREEERRINRCAFARSRDAATQYGAVRAASLQYMYYSRVREADSLR